MSAQHEALILVLSREHPSNLRNAHVTRAMAPMLHHLQ